MSHVFLHMGYPKCFSTTFQRSFLERHPQVHFAGAGIGNNISYAHSDIEFTFECLLKYARQSFYRRHRERARAAINRHIRQATSNQKIVFSAEHLVFSYLPNHLDLHSKLERLQDLFAAHQVSVIVVWRPQKELVYSLYKEYVKMGMPQSYGDFLEWIWRYRDRNFFDDLDYTHTFAQLSKAFGQDNVFGICFNRLKAAPQLETNMMLSQILDVRNLNLPIENNNPSLTDKAVEYVWRSNQTQRRGLGASLLHSFENHRNREALLRLDPDCDNDYIFGDVLAKRAALANIDEDAITEIRFNRLSDPQQQLLDRLGTIWDKSLEPACGWPECMA